MATPLDPDAALMLRVKRGDMKAFEELAEKYKQPIVNMMYRMLRDLDEAEDLAQNVFIRVYQSAKRYEVVGEVFHLDFHHRPAFVPERNPPARTASGGIARVEPIGPRRAGAAAV